MLQKKTTRPTYKNKLATRGYKFNSSSNPTGFQNIDCEFV